MKIALISLTAAALAACGASASGSAAVTPAASPKPAAYHTAVCQALADAKASNWSGAQNQWLAAQNAAGSDLSISLDFLNLNLATASLALDTVGGGAVKSSDLATYNADLAELPSGTTAC